MIAPAPELDPAEIALFLDIDGTLLGIEERPEYVVSTPELRGLLRTAGTALGGALALVSGRSLDDIERIFEPLEIAAVGSHGAEYRFPGELAEALTSRKLPAEALRPLDRLAASDAAVLLEHKSTGVAVHYRLAPQLADSAERAMREALQLAGDSFKLLSGKMVYELVPHGVEKGVAISTLMVRRPFRDRRPVFIGDDVTDETGFKAVNALGGCSIRVGHSADTAASRFLPDIAAVHQWLERSFSIVV